MRTFIAIDLPKNIKDSIAQFVEQLKLKGYRLNFTKNDNLHITVKFLGELPNENISNIIEFLDKTTSRYKQFEIILNKSGLFKNIKDPRILWIGQDNNIYFENIASGIDEIFAKENHICHITIARLKNNIQPQIKELLSLTENFVQKNHLSFKVEELCLFESILHSPSPIYKQIEKFKLKE